MGDKGLEPAPKTPGKNPDLAPSGAECGALGAREAPWDPELAAVVEAWPGLPVSVRARVAEIVRDADRQR